MRAIEATLRREEPLMAIENAGVARPKAEAHAEAVSRYIIPDPATKADLAMLKRELELSLTVRVLTVVLALNGLLFALIKLT
jgi:hypothetical protein